MLIVCMLGVFFRSLVMLVHLLKDVIKILKFSAPLIFASLLQMAMGIIDNMVVGHYSTQALASMAVAHGIFIVFFLLGLGVLLALRSLIAQAYAAEQKEIIGQYVCQGILLCIPFTLITWLAFYAYEPILTWAKQDPSLFHYAGDYLKVLALSIPAVFAFITLRQLTEGLGDLKISMWIALGGALLNIPFDLLFVFGYGPIPTMGASGAALTTTVLNYLMLGALLRYILKGKKYQDLFLFRKDAWLCLSRCKDILNIGLPLAGVRLGEVGFFIYSMLLMGWLGVNTLASHQVAINAASVSFMIPMGISMAMTVWIGREEGKKNLEGVRYFGWLGFLTGLLVMLPGAFVFWFFPEPVAALFTSDVQVIKDAAILLHYAAIFQIFDGTQVMGVGILQGVNDTKIPFLVIMITFWLIGAPLSYYAAFTLGFGGQGVWGVLILALALTSLAHMLRFALVLRKKTHA